MNIQLVSVEENRLAWEAGLREKDGVIAVNDEVVTDLYELLGHSQKAGWIVAA